MFSHLRSFLRAVAGRSRLAQEIEEEFAFHLERRTEELMRSGLRPAEARRRARLEFGSTERYGREGLDARGLRVVDSLRVDTRVAWRGLRRNPAFAAAAILTLALGVGGTAAAWGIARTLLLDPLPYADEDRLGIFWQMTNWNEEEFLFLRGRTPGFDRVALYRTGDVILNGDEGPGQLLPAVSGSAELFDVLGVQPFLGRAFAAGDDVEGAEPVAILSFGLWRQLGADRAAIGTRVTLNGMAHTVVGVMPAEFWFPDPAVRIWTAEPLSSEARSWNSSLVGRVAQGSGPAALNGAAASVAALLGERFDYAPQWDKTRDPRVTPVRDDMVGAMRPAILATLGAMLLILVIACVNVSALMLGRLDARRQELAVRVALGASRLRVLQQVTVEAVLIAAIAGLTGAAIAWLGGPLLARALPLGAWVTMAVPDARVFSAALAIAPAAALVSLLAPFFVLSRSDAAPAIATARTGGIAGRRGRPENALVVAEVAVAVLIAVGAALLGRSVVSLYALDPGVRAHGTIVVDVTLPNSRTSIQRQRIADIIDAIAAFPGVRTAGATQKLPLRDGGYNMPLTIDGRPDVDDATTEFRAVTPGYLETIGIPLIAGRGIERTDRADTEPVVVINEALARTWFPDTDPIGRYIGDGIGTRRTRIVGIVRDAAERGLTDRGVPVRYVASAQLPWVDPPQSIVIAPQAGAEVATLLDAARRTVTDVVPGAAVRELTTMRRVLDAAVGPVREVTGLLSLLTALALTLGGIGIYGVIAHLTARRRRDWAIRMALGLAGPRATALVIRHAAMLVLSGIAIGIAAAAIFSRLLASFLYGVPAHDPIAFLAAAALLLATGIAAAFPPARRIGRTDPAVVLREG